MTILISLLSAWAITYAHADSAEQIFELLSHGSKPSLCGPAATTLKDELTQADFLLRNTLKPVTTLNQRSCALYLSSLQRLLDQFEIGLKFDGDVRGRFMNDLRQRILIAALYSLHSMDLEQSEAGFDSLGEIQRLDCPFADRAVTTHEFNDFMSLVARYGREVLGNPGIVGFDMMTDQLLKYSDETEDRRDRDERNLTLASVAVSVLFWEYAPAAAARLITVPLSQLPRSLIVGSRVGGLTAEGLGFYYLDQSLFPDPHKGSEQLLETWSARLQGVNELAQAPLDSPSLYYNFLVQLKLRLSLLTIPWLHRHLPELTNQSVAIGILR